eukprot:15455548-Alexandrium_andersonii.AAC.1
MPGVSGGVGHMRRFGVRATSAESSGGIAQLARKPTRRASSSPEILKRLCPRCSSEGGLPGDSRVHARAVLQGRDSSGSNRAERAAIYPPALRAAIVR